MKAKTFNKITLIGILVSMLMIMVLVIVVDPYFHYHKPLSFLYYPLNNERYQNDGIVKNFDYDALITGTSMAENFKTSEFDRIFGVKSIKVPFSGARFGELNRNTLKALKTNQNLKIVLRVVDQGGLSADKDAKDHEEQNGYPHYLLDKNIINDVEYILNKAVISDVNAVLGSYGKSRGHTSFDEYANWNKWYTFGRESVLGGYTRVSAYAAKEFTTADEERIRANFRQNICATAAAYPNTDFYCIIPPYSICYWDGVQRAGELEYDFRGMRIAMEEMLKINNIKLFAFSNDFDLICNLDNYKDRTHYGEWVNSLMLERIKAGVGRLTEANYVSYLDTVYNFLSTYDYDALYK